MIKTIKVDIIFIAEGDYKSYRRIIDNYGASDFPSIMEVKNEMDILFNRLNVDTVIPQNSDL